MLNGKRDYLSHSCTSFLNLYVIMACLVRFYHFLQLKKGTSIWTITIILIKTIFQLQQYDLKPPRFGLVWFLVFDSCPSSFKFSCLDKNFGEELRLGLLVFDQSDFPALSAPFDGSLHYLKADFIKQCSYALLPCSLLPCYPAALLPCYLN